jgi:FixJ family two-component response regulator
MVSRRQQYFVSGLADETTHKEALAAGAVGFLSKPFGQKSLIDRLKTALMQSTQKSFTISKLPHTTHTLY